MSQLKDLYVKAVDKVGEEQAAVFEVHQMMLDDDDYVEGIETRIREEKMNAEAAVDQTAQELAECSAPWTMPICRPVQPTFSIFPVV